MAKSLLWRLRHRARRWIRERRADRLLKRDWGDLWDSLPGVGDDPALRLLAEGYEESADEDLRFAERAPIVPRKKKKCECSNCGHAREEHDRIEGEGDPGGACGSCECQKFVILKTETGRVLTHADIQALAEEAERGYDPDDFIERKKEE